MIFTEEIIDYSEQFTSDESEVLRELREHCYANFEDKAMLSGFVQGRILSMFSHMIRPKVVLEIGTYLGYSALCFAEGLANGGKVITLSVLGSQKALNNKSSTSSLPFSIVHWKERSNLRCFATSLKYTQVIFSRHELHIAPMMKLGGK